MRRAIAILGALVLMLATAGAGHAMPLSDLLNGGSITAGDKLFDSWSLMYYDTSDPTRSLNAANIDVTALTDGGLDPGPGLKFFFNSELTVHGDGIYAYVDLMFGFRVSVLDPALAIKDGSLELLWSGLGSSTGLTDGYNNDGMYVRESIGTGPGLNDLGVNEAEFSILDNEQTHVFSDSTTFSPQSQVWVTKNILVWAEEVTDSATLGRFDQRFSQVPVGVPEPGMLAMLALGGIALMRFKRS